MQSRRFPTLPTIGIFIFVYVIAGKFGLMLASLHASALRRLARESVRRRYNRL